MIKDLSKDIWNVPNALTMLRLALVPVFIVVYMTGHPYWALAVYVLASLTDALDGYLARSRNQITGFGKLMDPALDGISWIRDSMRLLWKSLVEVPLGGLHWIVTPPMRFLHHHRFN